MKPLQFKIEEDYDLANEEYYYRLVFFYEDGTTEIIKTFDDKPKGLELNKPYSIEDICGYAVVMNNKGKVEIW